VSTSRRGGSRATAEQLRVSGGHVEGIECTTDEGVGIRVSVPGRGFAFAATREVTKAGLELALARAVAFARALPAAPARDPLPPVPPALGHWSSPCEIDPFERSLDERLELLLTAEALLRSDPRIVRGEAESLAQRTIAAFASSDGAAVVQERTECGGAIAAHAAADGELQRRSYPSAHGGSVALARSRAPARARSGGTRATCRGGGARAAARTAVPGGPHDPGARRRAARAPGPRVDRPRARARPHPAR